MRTRALAALIAIALSWTVHGPALADTPITYGDALARAKKRAPDLAVARGREEVARAEVGVAGVHPNPTLVGGTSTQAAKLSIGASIPLVVLGQRGAAIRASLADLETVKIDGQSTWNEVRASAGHAFVSLWLAQRLAASRADAAALAKRVDEAVAGKVELGAVPELDGLRAHAERLRAEADAMEAEQLVAAAGSELGRWVGITEGASLHAQGEPDLPQAPPSLAELIAKVGGNPSIRRENADAAAAEARVDRERAAVRPTLVLDVGVDVGDPTLPTTNYRAQLAIEVPFVNQRGAYVDRERANAAAARARSTAERARLVAALEAAYRMFAAATARAKAIGDGVVPAAEAAAVAAEASYAAGRAPLVVLLDAERLRVDARTSLIDAQAARANAWIEVERAVGQP